ncbi:unnamed protein product [Lactuca virosa]|uniref:Uncharacterized protein n=1 Tax=Lactuca virosa TaxID=75947 RepID=A0AAU9PI45_9ASTR|nr:unnamed protein product [Lactuca virosa]
MKIASFVNFDLKNFNFVGSIPEVMLARIPLDNVIIQGYRKIPNSGVHKVHALLQGILDASDVPKRGGTKRKVKEAEGVSKKVKSKIKLKSKPVVMDAESEERIHIDVPGENTLFNEEDNVTLLEAPPKTSEKISSAAPLKKVNVTFVFGKENVRILSQDDINPLLSKEEKIAQAKRDKELDLRKEIKEECDAKDAEKRNTANINAGKKALFPSWIVESVGLCV